MTHTKCRGNRPIDYREVDFKGFNHIWAWQPSWSFDQHDVNKFSFPCTKRLHTKFGKNGKVVSEKSKF